MVVEQWPSKKAGVANKSTNLDRYIQPEGGYGPGQFFHNEPITRVGKQVKVLTQRGGYDI